MINSCKGCSSRTPIKHFVLNKALGQVVGVLSLRKSVVPAKLPLLVVDLCAGDGVAHENGTSSPEIIKRHLDYQGLKGRGRAILYEANQATFAVLYENYSQYKNMDLRLEDARTFNLQSENPQWIFLVLTKAPERYLTLPDHIASLPNVWFGTTIIDQKTADRVVPIMCEAAERLAFPWVSMEPLLGHVRFTTLDWCKLVVIGSQTATVQTIDGKRVQVPAQPARFEDVFSLVAQCRKYNVPYYLKPNLAANPGMALPIFPAVHTGN